MTATVRHLITYPIKGLSGQALDQVELTKARGFPFDRSFAFARNGSGIDPENPRPMPKSRFHVLAKDADLAKLQTNFDANSKTLSVQQGETSLVFDCSTTDGMNQAGKFIASAVGLPFEEAPGFIDGGDIHFTDVCVTSPQYMHAVSIINLASVRAFGEVIGREVDPNRFRGNLLIDGWEPFKELESLDKEVTFGGAKLRILKRIRRCPATQVNLETAQRDLDVPALLDDNYGHSDMGVYAEVIEGGTVTINDAISPL